MSDAFSDSVFFTLIGQVFACAIIGVVLLYGSIKIGLIYLISPRARREILGLAILLSMIPLLGVTILFLANNVGTQEICYGTAIILILLIKPYNLFRLIFFGVEVSLLELTAKRTNFIFNTGGKYSPGTDQELQIIHYAFEVDGKRYESKRFVLGKKLKSLTCVRYDRYNPKRNVALPLRALDKTKY